MSADKRTVSTDALETLGTIINPNEKRDAIHLAVIPVQATEPMHPSSHVHVRDGDQAYLVPVGTGLGIVDPFLTDLVQPGQWFWLVIYPRQITSLRHVWTHPAFDNSEVEGALPEVDPAKVEKAIRLIDTRMDNAVMTIEQVARDIGASFDELIEATNHWLRHGEYWNEGERFEGEHIPDHFWPAYEYYTKTIVGVDDRGNFLTCSC